MLRLRIYRDAAAAAKRDIYYRLRRYRAAETAFDDAVQALAGLAPGSPRHLITERVTAVAAAHVSTAERLPHLDGFVAALTAAAGAFETVVNARLPVSCRCCSRSTGRRAGVREYWALDKDPRAIAAAREYARDPRGPAPPAGPVEHRRRLAGRVAAGLPARCDLGLLLKVVPVVGRRQSPELLRVLAAIPATGW